MYDFNSGDLIRLSKPGAPGFEEKRVLSFNGETIIFENGKRLNINAESDWVITKVDIYTLRFDGGELHISGEFALFLKGHPPESVFENAVTRRLDGEVLLVRNDRRLLCVTRVKPDATS